MTPSERAAREAGFDDYEDVPKLYVPKAWHIIGSGFVLLGAAALIVWIAL